MRRFIGWPTFPLSLPCALLFSALVATSASAQPPPHNICVSLKPSQDGQTLPGGQTETFIWLVKNCGSDPILPSDRIMRVSGTGAPAEIDWNTTLDPPAATFVTLTTNTPTASGSYTWKYQFTRAGIGFSGDLLEVSFNISGSPPPPNDDADLILDLPPVVNGDGFLEKRWKFENTGESTWNNYKIKGQSDFDLVEISHTVPDLVPTDDGDVVALYHLPVFAGNYRNEYRLVSNSGHVFGPVFDVEYTVPKHECITAARLDFQNTPAVVPAGLKFPMRWLVNNCGNFDFGNEPGYSIVKTSSNGFSPPTLPVPDLAPGDSIELKADITVPETPGTYQLVYRYRSPSGAFFGDLLTVDVQVIPLVHVQVSATTLSRNAKGWPTPNPVSVTVTTTCPGGFPGCTGTLGFRMKGNLSRARMYIVSADLANACTGHDPDQVSTQSYDVFCSVAQTQTTVEHKWLVWIQDSQEDELKVEAFWGGNSDSKTIGIPYSEIHLAMIVPDILSTLSPQNHGLIKDPSRLDRIDSVWGHYRPLTRTLEKMGYVWGQTLFAMSYDWMQSHDLSGGFLDVFIEDALVAAGAKVPPPPGPDPPPPPGPVLRDGKVDLIVHGSGGLVARAYVQGLLYNNDVHSIVFAGTPHRGTAFAYRTWSGMEWSNYLNEYPLSQGGPPVFVPYVNNFVWPELVAERFNPDEATLDADCTFHPLSIPPIPPVDYYIRFHIKGIIPGWYACSADAVAGWAHTDKGAPALAELLNPDPDLVGGPECTSNPPNGQPSNPFLGVLNANVGLLGDRVSNIYGILGDSVDGTDFKHCVEPASFQTLWHHGRVEAGLFGMLESAHELFRYGRVFEAATGDGLVDTTSSCLSKMTGCSGLLDLPLGNEQRILGLRHESLLAGPDMHGFVAQFLAALNVAPIATASVGAFDATRAAAVTAQASASRFLSAISQGPVNVLITDFAGRKLGYDPVLNQDFAEIPGSTYSGAGTRPQILSFANPEPGGYTVTAFAYESGKPFAVQVTLFDPAGNVPLALLFGKTDPTTPVSQTFSVGAAPSVPQIQINQPAPVTETDATPVDVTFTVTLSEPFERELLVPWFTSDGEAKATTGSIFPPDYSPKSDTLTFAPGEIEKTITVQVLPDLIDEPDETFGVNLFNAFDPHTLITGHVTILDNDPPPVASIAGTSVIESEAGIEARFPVSLSLPSGFSIQITYETLPGTALAGQDFVATQAVLTFEPGETLQHVGIPIVDDDLPEGVETFRVRLLNPVHVTLQNTEATGIILDDDLGLTLDGAKEGGLAWCDFNNDGLLDVLANTSVDTPEGRSHVFFADGDGTFTDVTLTHAAGLARKLGARSAVCADVNNDGFLDFARNAPHRIEVYLNKGPRSGRPWSFGDAFQNPSQVIECSDDEDGDDCDDLNSEGLGFLDMDNDGDLDLVADNHDHGLELFQNDGKGRFSHVTRDGTTRGLPQAARSGDYLAVGDFDADGRVDLLARKEDAPDLFRNKGTSFQEVPSFQENPNNSNKGGVAFCDFDSDGDFDAVWTDAGLTQIWRNQMGTFKPTGEPGLSAGVDLKPRDIDGVACGDVDNDGDLDLFLGDSAGPSFLFRNQTVAGKDAPLAFLHDNQGIDLEANAEAVAYADYDRDGDLDLLVNADGSGNQLWPGTANDGDANRYLVVRALRCITPGCYRDDVGATIRLFAVDGVTPLGPIQEVNGGQGHGSQSPAFVFFGLPQGPDQPYLVQVRFIGKSGKLGPKINKQVIPSELGPYQLLEIKSCADANKPPLAFDRAVSTSQNTPVEIELLAHDPEGHPLTFQITAQPSHGTLDPLGGRRFRYTPLAGFSGRDTFTFVGTDGLLSSNPATITIQVLPPPQTEIALPLGLATFGAKEGGLAWCDFNHDGFPDALVNTNDASYLLFNDGASSFTDVTASHAAGLLRKAARRSAICADLNHDGFTDFARNDPGRVEIYLNRGPQAAPPWSFGDPTENPSQSVTSLSAGINTEGMAFLDYDLDGDLDIVLDNHDRGFALLRNTKGVFAQASSLGLPQSASSGDYLAVADYDVDGDVDLLGRKEDAAGLWRNNEAKSFTANSSFEPQASNSNKGGVAFCDLDSDGDFDVVWTDHDLTQIWRNDKGVFAPTGEPGISATVDLTPHDIDGVACADLDNDGDLDLFLGAAAGSFLFINDTLPGSESPLVFSHNNLGIDVPANTEGLAFADFDRDGDPDLLVNVDGAPNQLWRSHANDDGTNAYLAVRALRKVGTTYRDDVGATVRLFDSNGVTPLGPVQEVNGGQGHGSQATAILHFALPFGPNHDYFVEVRFLDKPLKPKKVKVKVKPSALGPYQLLEVRNQ